MEKEKELGFHNPQKDPLEKAADSQLQREELREDIKNIQEGKEEDKKEAQKNPPKTESKAKKIVIKSVIGLALLVVIVGVFLLVRDYSSSTNPDVLTYTTGFSFVKVQNYWVTRITIDDVNYDIPFRYNPYEVENITTEGNLIDYANAYKRYKYSYLTLDDWDEGGEGYLTMSVNEISKIFADVLGNKVIAACTSENKTGSCYNYNFTTKNCENTDEPVVYIKIDEETKLIGEGSCITVQGNGEDLIRATDKLFYTWFGVMDYELTEEPDLSVTEQIEKENITEE